MYTSSSYPCFNKYMRDRVKPHPFAMSVFYLSEGIRKLRAVAAQLDAQEFTQVVELWRGMSQLV